MISHVFLIITTILTFGGKQIADVKTQHFNTINHRVELMEQHCPPINTLGPAPSREVLELYREHCEPLKHYLESETGKKP